MTASYELAPVVDTPIDRPRYSVSLAQDEAEVRAAQRLRHQVFAGEMGAVLDTPEPGLDVDALDAYCDHLLVKEELTGEVVGTYRLLTPANARRAGRTYSESEFDLVSSPRSSTTWSRWAARACTPRTGTGPSSP